MLRILAVNTLNGVWCICSRCDCLLSPHHGIDSIDEGCSDSWVMYLHSPHPSNHHHRLWIIEVWHRSLPDIRNWRIHVDLLKQGTGVMVMNTIDLSEDFMRTVYHPSTSIDVPEMRFTYRQTWRKLKYFFRKILRLFWTDHEICVSTGRWWQLRKLSEISFMLVKSLSDFLLDFAG